MSVSDRGSVSCAPRVWKCLKCSRDQLVRQDSLTDLQPGDHVISSGNANDSISRV